MSAAVVRVWSCVHALERRQLGTVHHSGTPRYSQGTLRALRGTPADRRAPVEVCYSRVLTGTHGYSGVSREGYSVVLTGRPRPQAFLEARRHATDDVRRTRQRAPGNGRRAAEKRADGRRRCTSPTDTQRTIPLCRCARERMWAGVSPVPVQMRAVGERSPGADVGRGERSPGADVGGVRPVPAQMWQGGEQSRRRCGQWASSVPAQMWAG